MQVNNGVTNFLICYQIYLSLRLFGSLKNTAMKILSPIPTSKPTATLLLIKPINNPRMAPISSVLSIVACRFGCINNLQFYCM
jgi:hypothetical protein